MGMRASEVAGALLENYQGIDTGSPSLTFVQKGGQDTTMPVPLPVLAAIEAARGGRLFGPLITQRDGVSPMTRHGITNLLSTVNRRAAREGLKVWVNPHLLRKMAVTVALESNMPLRDVQTFARHVDARTTTRHYDLGPANNYRHPVHRVAGQLAV